MLPSKLRTLLRHRILHTFYALAARLLTFSVPTMNSPVHSEHHGVRPWFGDLGLTTPTLTTTTLTCAYGWPSLRGRARTQRLPLSVPCGSHRRCPISGTLNDFGVHGLPLARRWASPHLSHGHPCLSAMPEIFFSLNFLLYSFFRGAHSVQ